MEKSIEKEVKTTKKYYFSAEEIEEILINHIVVNPGDKVEADWDYGQTVNGMHIGVTTTEFSKEQSMICVDDLRDGSDDDLVKKHRTKKICFLFSDNNGDIHQFAKSINLSRELFKDDNNLPRYVLDEKQRIDAIVKGAVAVQFRKTVETCRANKNRVASTTQSKRRERERNEK